MDVGRYGWREGGYLFARDVQSGYLFLMFDFPDYACNRRQ